MQNAHPQTTSLSLPLETPPKTPLRHQIKAMTDPPQDLLDGISGALASEGYILQMILVTFIGLSCYNVAELVVLVPSTFRRWQGLYFWSLLASGCLGVVPYSIGFLMKFFTRADSVLSVTVLTIGWWTMVTGQSVVLYSRLHLVLRDEKVLRRVLWLIVANFFLLHVPTTILTYGANIVHSGEIAWVEGYNIMEKIQLTGFTIQESLISTLYVIETVKLLRVGAESTTRPGTRLIMYQLIGINFAIIAMDLLLLGLEYANFYAVQITLKGFVYSLKLKLEFAVLGKLVDLIQGSRHPISIAIADTLPLCSFTQQTADQDDDQPEVELKHGEIVESRAFVESGGYNN
ncbi:uncharacterized protein N7443_009400 [Penicillium atrosanguineum]|uniref:uncharacterized protein n=1 Tax=Penicillium atrosanguineum TaxID=1132637 RepID=UPI00239D2020|nr:uncharacterized protein N7443_009400 [Penicillium atrosanguineum]KAJ5293447.1 hypothetical protein N7443_009400 [Penicillium atrosanguineum]